jgi:uncharacterized phage-associated protein
MKQLRRKQMIVTHNREKLLNAIIYFIENSGSMGKTKLFKLLYFLDFEHFKETGRSVTGLEYHAWKMGPVPVALQEEIENPEADFIETLDVEFGESNGYKFTNFKSKSKFDSKYFTKRELRLLKDIADRYFMDIAKEMVFRTHLEKEPWHRVWEVEKRRFDKIPYEYILDENEKDFIQSLKLEREEIINNYK